MKRMFWSLGLSLATGLMAHGQVGTTKPTPLASLGIPRASLGLPQPVGSNGSPMILPTQFSQPLLPVGAVPTGAPEPLFPSPYRLSDVPKQMPKTAVGEDGKVDPKIGISSQGTGPVMVPGSSAPGMAISSGPFMGPHSGMDGDGSIEIPGAADPFIQRDRVRLSAEYLAWWTSGFRAPALVTTGPAMTDGILGQPGVFTLAGNERVSPTFRSGARFGAEWMFGPRQVWGVDGHFFFLGNKITENQYSSDQYPLLARPFFNTNRNIPFSEIVASPGVFSGGVAVKTSSSLLGGDLNLRRSLYQGCAWNIDVFMGYRYVKLTEELTIQESVALIPGAPAALAAGVPTNFISASAIDRFRTTNQFNGGQVGMVFERNAGRFVFTFRPSVALGETSSTLEIQGQQTSMLTTGPVTTQGGLLALNSNSGIYHKNHFAVVPEATLNIGYNLSQHCRVFVGYNFLYMSNVLRPGDQIDPRLDTNRIPGFPAAAAQSTVHPAIPFRERDFFAQGLNLGFMFKW